MQFINGRKKEKGFRSFLGCAKSRRFGQSTSMDLRLCDVVNKSQLREYVFLPQHLYSQYPNWVPPLYADEWHFHSPQHNSALSYSDVIRIIAYQGQKPVGRIMGIINKKYNKKHGERVARFFNLDCINQQEVAAALIRHIEAWAKASGMTKIIGPYGFSDKDPQGLQVEGFDHLPVVAAPVNPPYLQKLVEAEGYQKELDCVSYQLTVTKTLPPIFERIYERIKRHPQLRLIEFKNKRQLKPFIHPVFRLVNETYATLFGFVPMSEVEINKFAAQYLAVLDPAFVKVVTDETEGPVAFVVAMPDMSRGMQKAKGKLFPFGFIHILRSMKKSKQLNLLLGAVRPRFRGKGITVLLAKALFESATRRGLEVVDSHLILESNSLMRAECENIGGKLYKRFRIYQKLIRI